MAQREQYLADSVEYLNQATRLLFDTTKLEIKGRDGELFILLASCCNTALGIYKLLYADIHTENEAYMLMRTLLEKLVNFHYLRVSDDAEVERYFMHAYYKTYHLTGREETGIKDSLALKLDSSARAKLKNDPNIQRALALFSDTNPRMDWTTKTFRQRLRVVVDKAGINEGILILASMLTYGEASEVLHGSFYGSIFLSGAFTPGDFKDHGKPTEDEVGRNISAKLRLPLVLLAGIILGTVQILGATNNHDELVKEAKKLEARSIEILKA